MSLQAAECHLAQLVRSETDLLINPTLEFHHYSTGLDMTSVRASECISENFDDFISSKTCIIIPIAIHNVADFEHSSVIT